MAQCTVVGRSESGCSSLVLDTNLLRIEGAWTDGEAAAHSLGASHSALGAALTVPLTAPLAQGSSCVVKVAYSTSPEALALQWLLPGATAGGQHPYLFTQCQAIHARSLVPCQDSPAAKCTYSAAVRVPEGLTALMSAVGVERASLETAVSDCAGNAASGEISGRSAAFSAPAPLFSAPVKNASDRSTYCFVQKVPIPPYLIALVAGHLASAELGPRSRVWSEPSVLEAAAREFEDTERFLAAAEDIAGPYVWGRYDLLLLPPSFPYGGMENPCLTFVTPTLLAGDRSLVNVIAHEIAHSWTGNLVTNASWEHFWLNEGWTVWLERKILGRLHGEKAYQFGACLGFLELKDTVEHMGADHKYTKLVVDLSGRHSGGACGSGALERRAHALLTRS